MKKIIAYTAVLAALMAVSCSRMEENDLVDFQSSVITLSLNTTDMVETRSDIPAVESVVTQFDWFFYPDATGTSAPVYHGHATVGDSGLTFSGTDAPNASSVDEDGYHIGFDVENDAKYKNLKGDYYVYVLANYDGIDHSASDLTLATLLAKTMETKWDEKGKGYTAINDFVMDSYSGDDDAAYPQLIPLSAAVADESDATKANLAVDLQRVAAKISFTLNISKEITDDAELGTRWRPLINSANFTTYLVNALTYATVQGEALDADGELATGHQLSYDTGHIKTNKTQASSTTYIWEVDPFYTYPVEFDIDSNNAPYFKLALPWENVDASGNLTDKGSTLFYYKAYLREKGTDGKPGKALTSFDRNKHYIVTLNVDVLGGTPEDYTILDTFYYVADWQSPADGTYDGYFAPRYLDIARPEYYLYGDNSITIAVTSSHVIDAEITSVSQKTIAGANKMTTVPATAKVTPDGRVSFTLEYPLTTAMPGGNMDITPITWTVHVYHADDEDVSKDVTIYQYPSIYGEMRRTGYAQTAAASSFSNTTDTYYTFLNGTRYSFSNTGTAVQANNTGVYLGSINGGSPESRDKLILTVSTLSSLTSVTAFTKDGTAIKFSEVAIGDPRSKISLPITDSQGNTWSRNDLGDAPNYIDNYLVADPDKNKYIAPRFMFPAGRLGSNRINSNLEQGGSWRANAERCAAYQEGGYPAGRWRLPTEAEVAFCKQLQDEGYIDGMYYPGNRYWTASGTYYLDGAVIDPADEPNTRPTGNQNNGSGIYRTASSRCVYDLWYWGEEPYNNDKQPIALEDVEWVNPAKTNTPANTWLGFMTE